MKIVFEFIDINIIMIKFMYIGFCRIVFFCYEEIEVEGLNIVISIICYF